MKIIFVTREGYNLAGARIRAYNFSKELRRRGIDAEVLSYADKLGAKDGIYEASMGLSEKIKHNIAAYRKLCCHKDAIIVLQRVNYHSFAPLLTCIIKRNRLVLDIDDWETREDPRYLFGFYPTSKAEYLTRRIARLADFCITGSLYLKDYILRFNKEVHYIPSCVNTEFFCPNGINRKAEDVKFAWIGTLHRRDDVENVKFIIDCFKRVNARSIDISLDIVGDGIYRQEIERYISGCTLKHKINFIGWVHPDKMPSYLEDIDIGLFPLIQNTRFNLSKSPTKLFEYMAMKKPTVSSRMGEAMAIVEDEKDGFLANDKGDFIHKMEILAKDISLRREMGYKARAKVTENYSLSFAGDKLSRVFGG
ncbi:glycosyltransferase [Candidatus Omnitrophota bacterium]